MKKWTVKDGKVCCRKCKKELWAETLGGIITVLREGRYHVRCPACKVEFRIRKTSLKGLI